MSTELTIYGAPKIISSKVKRTLYLIREGLIETSLKWSYPFLTLFKNLVSNT
jgi:hypothetical protein